LRTDTERGKLIMSIATVRSSYVCAIIATVAFVAVGSVWAAGNSQNGRISAQSVRIDVSNVLSSAEVAKLPVLYVKSPI
jgi:hypothetical protein